MLLGLFNTWTFADTQTSECKDEVPYDLLEDEDDKGRDKGHRVTVVWSVIIFALKPGSKSSIYNYTTL